MGCSSDAMIQWENDKAELAFLRQLLTESKGKSLPELHKGNKSWSISREGDFVVERRGDIEVSDHISMFDDYEVEMLSRWRNHLIRGYSEERKLRKIVDHNPMLARNYRDYEHDQRETVIVQLKINGIRCVAEKKSGIVSLYFRGGTEITSCPHIQTELAAAMQEGDVWDGEISTEDGKPDDGEFHQFEGMIRRKEPNPISLSAFYHVFDVITEGNYVTRMTKVQAYADHILLVHSMIRKHSEIMPLLDEVLDSGYEGLIIRKKDAPYTHGRTKDLLKLKELGKD